MSGAGGRGRDDVDWAALADVLGERLLAVDDPLAACRVDPQGAACHAALSDLHNPFAVEEHPAGFHTTGWYDAFEDRTAKYAVAAESPDDVASALEFARANGVRVSIKGTGHDYLGRSGAPGALLVWTHRMRQTEVHESFSAAGSPPGPDGRPPPGVPALSVAAGTRWLEAYRALEGTGRQVSGGWCTTVGAAGGFTMGGGYSSFARRFGTAAGNVLEMEVVMADGAVLVVSEHQHPDLFWALRGGGGGTFGVVTRVTYATHPAPFILGGASGTIRASSDRAYRALVERVVDCMPALATEHCGRTSAVPPRSYGRADDDLRGLIR